MLGGRLLSTSDPRTSASKVADHVDDIDSTDVLQSWMETANRIVNDRVPIDERSSKTLTRLETLVAAHFSYYEDNELESISLGSARVSYDAPDDELSPYWMQAIAEEPSLAYQTSDRTLQVKR